MKWTHAGRIGSALHDDAGKLLATIRVRPTGVFARWHNGLTWDNRDQVSLVAPNVAATMRVRLFKTRQAAIRAINMAIHA